MMLNSRLQPTQIALGTVQEGVDKLRLNFEYNTGSNTDNNGNVLKQTITVNSTPGQSNGFTAVQTYGYDELNRLKTATENIDGNQTPSWKETNIFDRYGNKNFDEANTTTITKACGTSPNFVMCVNDRKRENPEIDPVTNRIKELQPDGDSNKDYEFDAAGNTIKDPDNRRFKYDGENKQVAVVQLDANGNETSTIGQYFYDGDGKRVKKYVPATGETTIFHYDAEGKLIAEYSTVVAPASTAQVSYLTNDHLGSPRITTDKNGNVFSRRDFLPFGEELTASHTTQRNSGVGYAADSVRQKFTGYERDAETDLDFAQTRYYDKIIGRFGSADFPFADQIEDEPASWNLYVYAGNSPLKFIDPFGLWKQVPCTNAGQCWIAEAGDTYETLAADIKKAGGFYFGHFGNTYREFFSNQEIVAGAVFSTEGFQEWWQGQIQALSDSYEPSTDIYAQADSTRGSATATLTKGGKGILSLVWNGTKKVLGFGERTGSSNKAIGKIAKSLNYSPSKAVRNACLGRLPLDKIPPKERELAAQFYEQAAGAVTGPNEKAAKALNLARAKFLREGGSPPGNIQNFYQ